MRLIVTQCDTCKKITDAKHAETLEDLESVGSFIGAKKQSGQKLKLMQYGSNDSGLVWCKCPEEIPENWIAKSSFR